MHFQATLVALTLTVAGIMIILFALDPRVFSLPVVLGVVLTLDGLYVAIGGFTRRSESGQRRYYFLWGFVTLIAGLTLLAATTVSVSTLTPFVIGALLILLGVVALWSASNR
jgi:uncharacterized membrane protein HdeD (DUF308 family)